MAKEFSYNKKEKLKSKKQLDELFQKGKSFTVFPVKIFYAFADEQGNVIKTGVGVSSRHFKKAVQRNRIKRLTKEAWRLQKNDLQDSLKEQNRKLNVFFIYTGKELPAYDEVYSSMKKIIVKLQSDLS